MDNQRTYRLIPLEVWHWMMIAAHLIACGFVPFALAVLLPAYQSLLFTISMILFAIAEVYGAAYVYRLWRPAAGTVDAWTATLVYSK